MTSEPGPHPCQRGLALLLMRAMECSPSQDGASPELTADPIPADESEGEGEGHTGDHDTPGTEDDANSDEHFAERS